MTKARGGGGGRKGGHLDVIDVEEAFVAGGGDQVIAQLEGWQSLRELVVGVADVVEEMEEPLRDIHGCRIGVTELQLRTDLCDLWGGSVTGTGRGSTSVDPTKSLAGTCQLIAAMTLRQRR
jgi:hypothetical protein